MAIKRRNKNGTRQQAGPDSESPFVNIPWGRTQDEEFDAWLEANPGVTLLSLVEDLHRDKLGIKLGAQGDSRFCTLDSMEAKDAGSKYLLSGWSDSIEEATAIAFFKWVNLLERNWEHPTATVAKSRRR
jgi:hypothetical protein